MSVCVTKYCSGRRNGNKTDLAGNLLLADRTNGRAIATLFRLSVCRLWRYVLWLNGAS